jgi:hypothetical protein
MSGNGSQSTELERRAKALFDAEVDNIDGRTRSRLAQARYAALEACQGKPRWSRQMGLRVALPAAAAAAVAVAVLAVWRAPEPAAVSPQLAALQDLEILLSEEELEMLEELEFYAWLEEQPEFSAPLDDDVG